MGRRISSRIKRLEERPRHRERNERAERMQAALDRARQHPVYGEDFCAAERELMAFLAEHGYPLGGGSRRDPRREVEALKAAMRADLDRYIKLVESFNDLFFAIESGREPYRLPRGRTSAGNSSSEDKVTVILSSKPKGGGR